MISDPDVKGSKDSDRRHKQINLLIRTTQPLSFHHFIPAESLWDGTNWLFLFTLQCQRKGMLLDNAVVTLPSLKCQLRFSICPCRRFLQCWLPDPLHCPGFHCQSTEHSPSSHQCRLTKHSLWTRQPQLRGDFAKFVRCIWKTEIMVHTLARTLCHWQWAAKG